MQSQQVLQIKALEHLIEADFDSSKCCQSVCLLTAELFKNSDDKVQQELASVAYKAYLSTAETVPIK